MDLSNSEKNGILYMEDPIEKEWVPHFFVLNQTKMFYTEVQSESTEPEEAEEEEETDSAKRRLREVTFWRPLRFVFVASILVSQASI